MKTILIVPLLLAANVIAPAQNAPVFPGRPATSGDLMVASNRADTTLTQNVAPGDTALNVAATSGFRFPSLVTIDNEIINVCSAAANVLNVCPGGRGFDQAAGSGAAAAHLAGVHVQGRFDAWMHNQIAAEVQAIEKPLSLMVKGSLKLYTAINHFGDSITCAGAGQDCLTNALGGYDSSSYASSYVGLVDAAFGVAGNNQGVSGSQAADQQKYVYQLQNPATAPVLSTIMLGTNDSLLCGPAAGCIGNFQQIQQAEAAYLALPASAVQKAQNCSTTGSWTNSADYGGQMSQYSAAAGSTMTCSWFGDVLYFAYTVSDGNTGTFSAAVEGPVNIGSWNSFSSTPINTGNQHTTRASFLARVLGSRGGPHSVTFTVTSTSGSVQIDWVAGNRGFQGPNVPDVIAGAPPLMTCAGPPAAGGCDVSTVYLYNQAVQDNVAELAADGLNVFYADTTSDPQYAAHRIADGIHPNDAGHASIAAQFLWSLTSTSSPAVKSGAKAGASLGSGIIQAAGPWTWAATSQGYHQIYAPGLVGSQPIIGRWGQASAIYGGAGPTDFGLVATNNLQLCGGGAGGPACLLMQPSGAYFSLGNTSMTVAGTTSPYARFLNGTGILGYLGSTGAFAGGATYNDLGVVSNTNHAFLGSGVYPRVLLHLNLDHVGLINTTAPSASSCGTSPTVFAGSNSWYGLVTIGTGGTGCAITWATVFTTNPIWGLIYGSDGSIEGPTTLTTSGMTFSGSAGVTYRWMVLQ